MDEDRLDAMTASFRDRLGEAPPAVTDAAVAAYRGARSSRALSPSRLLLLLAGVGGVALDLPAVLGAAMHTSQDVAVLHLAIAVGFLLAAWRPQRYARGLAPVALAAAVLLMLPAGSNLTEARGALGEVSHLPVLLGAAVLAFGGWLTPSVGVRSRA